MKTISFYVEPMIFVGIALVGFGVLHLVHGFTAQDLEKCRRSLAYGFASLALLVTLLMSEVE